MTNGASYLTLRLEKECLGLPLLRVKEIIEPEAVTRVPGAAKPILGVINLRGSVVPVVELAAALGLREPQAAQCRCVVLLETDVDGDRTPIGLACDSVEGVVEVAPEDVEPAPAFGTRIAAHHLAGLAKSRDLFVLLLDVERALGGVVLGAAATSAVAAGAAEAVALQQ